MPRSLGVGDLAAAGRTSFRVYVHLDAEGGWLNGRSTASAASGGEADVCGVGAAVVAGRGGAGQCGAGVADRARADRRLVLDRDRGCRFPGVSARRIWRCITSGHWADGGSTDLDNLVGCARSTTMPTTVGSSDQWGSERPGRVGVHGPRRLPDRFPILPDPGLPGPCGTSTADPELGNGAAVDVAAGPDGPDGGAGRSTADGLGGRADGPRGPRVPPTEDADAEPLARQDERGGSAGAYQGADRRSAVKDKWVTFHEAPDLRSAHVP